MNIFKQLSLILGIVLIQGILQAMKPLAVVVTCKTAPGAKRPDFIADAVSCEKKQEGCDYYKNDPFYGPATATSCEPFYNMTLLKAQFTKEFAKGRRYPGSESAVTICKVKQDGTLFAVPSCDTSKGKCTKANGCSPEAQKRACDAYGANTADPVSCDLYLSPDWAESILAKYPLRFGLECQISGAGVPYRIAVPSCASSITNALCDPKAGKITQCSQQDPEQLKKWVQGNPVGGLVSCRLNDIPTTVVDNIPGRDCSVQSGKEACGVWGKPVGCIPVNKK